MKRWTYGVAAAVVIAGVVLLARSFARREPPRQPVSLHAESEFPATMRAAERDRQSARETLPMACLPGAAEPPAWVRGRDPFLAAVPPVEPGGARWAIVVEVAAIASSPVGRIVTRCLSHEKTQRMHTELGFGPEAIHRVGMSDDLVILGGNFAGAKLDGALAAAERKPRGAHGVVYARGGGQAVGVYGDGVLLNGTLDAVGAAIDRMDGGAIGRGGIPEDLAYGDLYGVLAVDQLAKLFDGREAEIVARIGALADRTELHASAAGDVLVIVGLEARAPGAAQELRNLLETSLAAARTAAWERKSEAVTDLLSTVRLESLDGRVRVAAAIPLHALEADLSWCAKLPDAGADVR